MKLVFARRKEGVSTSVASNSSLCRPLLCEQRTPKSPRQFLWRQENFFTVQTLYLALLRMQCEPYMVCGSAVNERSQKPIALNSSIGSLYGKVSFSLHIQRITSLGKSAWGFSPRENLGLEFFVPSSLRIWQPAHDACFVSCFSYELQRHWEHGCVTTLMTLLHRCDTTCAPILSIKLTNLRKRSQVCLCFDVVEYMQRGSILFIDVCVFYLRLLPKSHMFFYFF